MKQIQGTTFGSSYWIEREIEISGNWDLAIKLVKQFFFVCRFVLGLSKGNPGSFSSSSLSTRKVFCSSKFEYMTQDSMNA